MYVIAYCKQITDDTGQKRLSPWPSFYSEEPTPTLRAGIGSRLSISLRRRGWPRLRGCCWSTVQTQKPQVRGGPPYRWRRNRAMDTSRGCCKAIVPRDRCHRRGQELRRSVTANV